VSDFRFRLGRGPQPPGRSVRSDLIRLAMMAALLVVLLVMALNPQMMSPFRSEEATPTTLPDEDAHAVWLTQPASRPAETLPTTHHATPWPTASAAGLPTGIDRSVLNDVRDLAEIESLPYYETLRAVRAMPAAAFIQPGLPQATVPDLLNAPDLYRGRLVTVTGNLRRINRVPLLPNASGLDHVTEGQIRYDTTAFFTFVAINDPREEVAVGRQMTFTGVFFKVYVYRDREGRLRRSPLVLGADLRPVEPTVGAARWLPVILSTVMGVLLLLTVLLVFWRFRRSDRRFDRFRRPPPDALKDFHPEDERSSQETGHDDEQA
jgi:hypothetical protein